MSVVRLTLLIYRGGGCLATPLVPVSDLVLKLGNDGTEVITAELGTLNAEVRSMVTGLGVSDPSVPLKVSFLQSLHYDTGSVAVEFDGCHGWFPLVDSFNIQEMGARGGSRGHLADWHKV